jgi:hypothetical protein
MFSLEVTDHVRMDTEHVARNYTIHAKAAQRLARVVLIGRIVMALLLAIATAASIANLLFEARPFQIAAIAAAGLALIGFALYTVLGLESRVYAHRAFAHRLWLASEQYRSLMTEINQGLVDQAVLLRRRDELMNRLHAIYEHGFGVDQPGFENTRLPALPPGTPETDVTSGQAA